jgi:ring-1,2-phenylacetyl-CoA epoxidase subunit PaaE
MRQFHKLSIEKLGNETPDSIRLTLAVPSALRDAFAFQPGQHLPMQAVIGGKLTRRTYSICSVPGQWPLEVGIRIQPEGVFSGFVANALKVGDQLEVMPPFGQFHASIDAGNDKTYLAVAAGSGITPILSIVRAVLEGEPGSRIAVFYGNRRQRTTMFIDDLYALKNRFPERLQLYFLFSQEEQEFPIFGGRLDEDRTRELCNTFLRGLVPDQAFVCGPDTMIDSVRAALRHLGMGAEDVHAERYGAPRKRPATIGVPPTAGDAALTEVTVIMDGHEKSFSMSAQGSNIVDAAAEHGIELPYSCKGGICATCRTWLKQGEVRMEANYGLEPWEIDKGFVLACQSHPLSRKLVLDYDKT